MTINWENVIGVYGLGYDDTGSLWKEEVEKGQLLDERARARYNEYLVSYGDCQEVVDGMEIEREGEKWV